MAKLSRRATPIAEKGACLEVDSHNLAGLEALLVLHRYRDWIIDEFRPYLRGRAVEIGAGIGSYSEAILRSVRTLDLVEPSSSLFRTLTDRYAFNDRVSLIEAPAEDWATATLEKSYDTAVMINVLEHIKDDAGMLAELRRVLRPGGHLLLFVPALGQLYSPLDRLVGHYRRYHLPALRQQVETAGMRIITSRYFDLLGAAPWFVINRLLRQTQFSPQAARIYDSIGVPVTRMIESWITPPFGKNILLVAQRD